jgi:DNA-binding response OmpR family regulator
MRVLIVEDNTRLAALMCRLVEGSGLVADVAHSVDAAQTALALVDYDVVLLDLSLPDGDGHAVLSTIRQSRADMFILVVTARGDVISRVEALNAGADDYVVKPFSDEELIARIRAVGRRPRRLRDEVLAVGNLRLDTGAMVLTIDDRVVAIPRRELSVLSALMGEMGRVLRKDKLESAVYSLDSEVTENAVEAAVSRLRRRLDAEGATVDLTAMRGLGYILTERAQT